MKITIQPSLDYTKDKIKQHSATVENPCDDLTVNEVAELFGYALAAYGFNHHSITRLAEALQDHSQ